MAKNCIVVMQTLSGDSSIGSVAFNVISNVNVGLWFVRRHAGNRIIRRVCCRVSRRRFSQHMLCSIQRVLRSRGGGVSLVPASFRDVVDCTVSVACGPVEFEKSKRSTVAVR